MAIIVLSFGSLFDSNGLVDFNGQVAKLLKLIAVNSMPNQMLLEEDLLQNYQKNH